MILYEINQRERRIDRWQMEYYLDRDAESLFLFRELYSANHEKADSEDWESSEE